MLQRGQRIMHVSGARRVLRNINERTPGIWSIRKELSTCNRIEHTIHEIRLADLLDLGDEIPSAMTRLANVTVIREDSRRLLWLDSVPQHHEFAAKR